MLPFQTKFQQLWLAKFHRRPLEGNYKIVNDDKSLEEACCTLPADPFLPGIFGVDVEFYHGTPSTAVFSSWPKQYKNFPIEVMGKNCAGPFVHTIQMACADGLCFVLDIFAFQQFPG